MPDELGLGWGARGCEGSGLGGKADRGEQTARAGGVGDECHDVAAATAVSKDVAAALRRLADVDDVARIAVMPDVHLA